MSDTHLTASVYKCITAERYALISNMCLITREYSNYHSSYPGVRVLHLCHLHCIHRHSLSSLSCVAIPLMEEEVLLDEWRLMLGNVVNRVNNLIEYTVCECTCESYRGHVSKGRVWMCEVCS